MEYEWCFERSIGKCKGYWEIEGSKIKIYSDECSIIHELIEASVGAVLLREGICKRCENCNIYVSSNKPFERKGVCHVATVMSRAKSYSKLPKYIKEKLMNAKNGKIMFLEG